MMIDCSAKLSSPGDTMAEVEQHWAHCHQSHLHHDCDGVGLLVSRDDHLETIKQSSLFLELL